MTFFRRNFEKPGPGVPRDAPRKKGIARVVELLVRDFWVLMKLNILFVLFMIPPQVLVYFTISSFGSPQSLIFGASALLVFIPLGTARTAMFYCITKMLRDDPGFVWHDFKKAFKSSFRTAAVPGMVHELIFCAQILFVLNFFAGEMATLFSTALLMLSLLLFNMISPYFFLQASCLDLKTAPLLFNSLLLTFSNFLRSFAGGLLGGTLMLVLSALNIVLEFALLPLVILIGFSLPTFLCLTCIWPPTDKVFGIEETIRRRNDKLRKSANL